MKIHEMKLLRAPFEEIKAGRKNVEMRLYDEKRRGIAAGDAIVFTCPELAGQKITVKVRGVYIYEDFLPSQKATLHGSWALRDILANTSRVICSEYTASKRCKNTVLAPFYSSLRNNLPILTKKFNFF